MTFDYLPMRLRFTARDAIRFSNPAGNTLRGALGMEAPERLFRPAAPGSGPSGLVDPPRPFVLRARALDGCTIAPGEHFDFSAHLFDLDPEAAEALIEAFRVAVDSGIGPGRGSGTLDRVERPAGALRLPLDGGAADVRRISVEFLSPTELKPAGRPEFSVLFARARDRVSTLRALYGAGPLELDFRRLGEQARAVSLVRCEVRTVEARRRSSRTGQSHPIGGFVGTAEYEGDIGAFLPLLRAAEITGVGRHTVWGNGEIRVALDAALAR